MKRKAVDPANEPTLDSVPPRIPASQLVHLHNGQHAAQGVQSHGRRQPQTSCDSCRKRKLKCDRGQPCSSCVTRGLPCEGQQGLLGPPSAAKRIAIDTSTDASSTDEILKRLRVLEEIVFESSHRESGALRDHNSPRSIANASSSSLPGGEYHASAPTATMSLGRLGILRFRIVPNRSGFNNAFEADHDCIWMMPKVQALALLQDYIDHVYPLLPVIHGATTRGLIMRFYDDLSRGEQLPHYVAALILTLSALSAYFWQPDVGFHGYFASAEEAAEASLFWRDWAFDILANATKETNSGTMESVQAWAVMTYMIHNVEGCSSRFRILHNRSLTAARELLFHLTDSPRSARSEDEVTRELKRRIWWYIAGTDWLLGFMGGPNEGTYSVHPRHMKVNHPRNIDDDDMGTVDKFVSATSKTFTQMSYFIQRTRIAEIIREVLDASHPGGPDTDITDCDQVLALDDLFAEGLVNLPPFFQGQEPPQSNRFSPVELQRLIVQLGLLTRRARLHRPFLLLQQSHYTPSQQRSRAICLRTTRDVVSMAIDVIQLHPSGVDSTGSAPKTKTLSAHRLGLVINHLSTACTVLAIYASSTPRSPHQASSVNTTSEGQNRLSQGQVIAARAETDDAQSRAAVSEELAHAGRVLSALGAGSPVAAELLRNLVTLLKRHHAKHQGGATVGGFRHRGGDGDNGGDGDASGDMSSNRHSLTPMNGSAIAGKQVHHQGQQQQQQQHQTHAAQQQYAIHNTAQINTTLPPATMPLPDPTISSIPRQDPIPWQNPAPPPAQNQTPGVLFPLSTMPTAPTPSLAFVTHPGGGQDGMAALLAVTSGPSAVPGPLIMDNSCSPFSLDGIWTDFVTGSTDDYNQLFADLDYYCGIA